MSVEYVARGSVLCALEWPRASGRAWNLQTLSAVTCSIYLDGVESYSEPECTYLSNGVAQGKIVGYMPSSLQKTKANHAIKPPIYDAGLEQ